MAGMLVAVHDTFGFAAAKVVCFDISHDHPQRAFTSVKHAAMLIVLQYVTAC
jgi:hypothetical protein